MLPSVLKLDKGNKVFISRLLHNNNYIYPEKPNTEVRNIHDLWHISWDLTWQEYATNKPYQNNIVLESLKIAFGSMMNIRDPKHYGYSHKDYCKEREVPAYMVAVAATAVGFYPLSFFPLSDPHSRTTQPFSTSFMMAMAMLSSLLLPSKVSFVAIWSDSLDGEARSWQSTTNLPIVCIKILCESSHCVDKMTV